MICKGRWLRRPPWSGSCRTPVSLTGPAEVSGMPGTRGGLRAVSSVGEAWSSYTGLHSSLVHLGLWSWGDKLGLTDPQGHHLRRAASLTEQVKMCHGELHEVSDQAHGIKPRREGSRTQAGSGHTQGPASAPFLAPHGPWDLGKSLELRQIPANNQAPSCSGRHSVRQYVVLPHQGRHRREGCYQIYSWYVWPQSGQGVPRVTGRGCARAGFDPPLALASGCSMLLCCLPHRVYCENVKTERRARGAVRRC